MGKYKFFLLFILLIAGIPVIFSYQFFSKQGSGNEDNIKFFITQHYGGVLTVFSKNLVDPIILDEKPTLGKIVSELRKVEGVDYVAICDGNGKILVSIKPGEEGKTVKEIIGKDVNLGKNSLLHLNTSLNKYFLRVPIKFEAGNKEKVVGNLIVGINPAIISEVFSAGSNTQIPYVPIAGVFLVSIIVAFLLAQILIFSPLNKKIEAYEARHRRYLTFESLKKVEEETKTNISKLEEKRNELESEISKLENELEAKRKELEETDIGKIVQELEEKKKLLEEEIERLKKEEEEVRQKLHKEKMEQEELKKRLDIIRKKMKQIMGP